MHYDIFNVGEDLVLLGYIGGNGLYGYNALHSAFDYGVPTWFKGHRDKLEVICHTGVPHYFQFIDFSLTILKYSGLAYCKICS